MLTYGGEILCTPHKEGKLCQHKIFPPWEESMIFLCSDISRLYLRAHFVFAQHHIDSNMDKYLQLACVEHSRRRTMVRELCCAVSAIRSGCRIFENWHERVMRSLVMDRIAESVSRRLEAVQPSLPKWLQLILQLSKQTCLVKKTYSGG